MRKSASYVRPSRQLWAQALDESIERSNRAERALSAREPAVARRHLAHAYALAMDALAYGELCSDVADAREALRRVERLRRAADELI